MPKTKISTINTSGCIKRNGNTKIELKNNLESTYFDYSAENIYHLICNKRQIIDNKKNGNFNACELLIDIENFENKYLSLNQRKVIKCVCENGMTLKQTANKLNTTRKEIADLLDSILETLKMKICEKQ